MDWPILLFAQSHHSRYKGAPEPYHSIPHTHKYLELHFTGLDYSKVEPGRTLRFDEVYPGDIFIRLLFRTEIIFINYSGAIL